MSKEKVDAYMPLWIGDYLKKTMGFSTVEHGAYLLLLLHYWQVGPFENDEKSLLNVTRLKGRGARDVLRAVLTKFDLRYPSELPNSVSQLGIFSYPVWCHSRVDQELAKSREIKNKRRESGKLGGLARSKCLPNAIANGVAKGIAKLNPPSPSPSLPSEDIYIPCKEGGNSGTGSDTDSGIWQKCKSLHMTQAQFDDVALKYKELNFSKEIIPHAIGVLDRWMTRAESDSAKKAAKNIKTHHQRLCDPWVIKEARGMVGHRPGVEDAARMANHSSRKVFKAHDGGHVAEPKIDNETRQKLQELTRKTLAA